MGGIIAATTQPPPARTSAEAPSASSTPAPPRSPTDGGRFDAFAGGRYSYTAAALSIFAPDTRLEYWDYQTGAGWQQSAKNRLSVLAFGSNDYLGEIEGGEEKELFAASFHRMQLRFDHGPRRPRGRDAPRDITARLAFTFGVDRRPRHEGQMTRATTACARRSPCRSPTR